MQDLPLGTAIFAARHLKPNLPRTGTTTLFSSNSHHLKEYWFDDPNSDALQTALELRRQVRKCQTTGCQSITFMLLSYVWNTKLDHQRNALATAAKTPLELLVRLLTHEVRRIRLRGLERGYITKIEQCLASPARFILAKPSEHGT